MKNIILLLIIVVFITGCFKEEDNSADPGNRNIIEMVCKKSSEQLILTYNFEILDDYILKYKIEAVEKNQNNIVYEKYKKESLEMQDIKGFSYSVDIANNEITRNIIYDFTKLNVEKLKNFNMLNDALKNSNLKYSLFFDNELKKDGFRCSRIAGIR